ncbi:MAG TPA: hypothetical protein VKA84_20950 [Gemmatimonadaceae bacterium]|nr:hypothetical protein [Gemmatimonadaceae bacterium]
MNTLADTLRHFAPLVPEALVSRRALARATDAAALMPAALSNLIYLECRLRADDDRVDLAVNVDQRGRGILAGTAPASAALGDDVRAHPAWARVGELARRWADPAAPLADAVEGIWLELDDAAGRGAVPAPGVFVDFDHRALAAGGEGDGADRLMADALAPLLGGAVPRDQAARLRPCLDALPAGAFVIYLGVMLSRAGADASPPVRVCAMGVKGPALANYLRAAGWPGDPHEIARVAAELAPAGAAMVHLDVGAAGVAPALGLELTFARRPQLDGVLAEAGLLDALAARGLCAAEKRDALAAWPGYRVETLPHELWPSVVVRRLNHVKVVCGPEGAREAKAYLCVHHEPRARRWTPGSIP